MSQASYENFWREAAKLEVFTLLFATGSSCAYLICALWARCCAPVCPHAVFMFTEMVTGILYPLLCTIGMYTATASEEPPVNQRQ